MALGIGAGLMTEEKKPARGRPKTPDHQKLWNISSRVDPVTYQTLCDIARDRDESLSQLIRAMLTACAFAQKARQKGRNDVVE